MKNILTIAVFCLLISIQHQGFAQQNITINEVLTYMSKGEKPGLEVAIVDTDIKTVSKDWIKFMKQYKAKSKQPKKSKEIFTDNATISNMSENTVDVYTTLQTTEYGTKLTACFDLGGSFVSSQDHEIAFGAAKELLRKFALNEAKNTTDLELKAQNEILKSLNKELDKLLGNKSSNIKEVEKAKALIASREQDIAALENSIVVKKQQIDIQKEILDALKNKVNQLK